MEEKKPGFWKGLLWGCFGTAVLMLGLGAWLREPESSSLFTDTASATERAFARVEELNSYIDEVFLFEPDAEALENSLLKGYVEGLGDPYSAYYTADEMASVMESLNGSYYGIGVSVNQNEDGWVEIAHVFSDSPAMESGLLPGDYIVGVDEQSVAEMDLNQVVACIRGAEGSTVTLQIVRDGAKAPLTVEVERRDVQADTVSSQMLEDGLGYLQLLEFQEASCAQVTKALEELGSQGMTTLVLDLRDNPGGLLTSVVDIADLFLPEGEKIFYMEDKAGNREDYDTEEDALFEGPMVVLVNENSASAAEVLAGCLKDHGRALLVGQTTFGKGIVQTYFDLSDGAGLKLTTDHYFTPNGNDIHGVGIEPDIEVPDPEIGAEDQQLLRAQEEAGKLR